MAMKSTVLLDIGQEGQRWLRKEVNRQVLTSFMQSTCSETVAGGVAVSVCRQLEHCAAVEVGGTSGTAGDLDPELLPPHLGGAPTCCAALTFSCVGGHSSPSCCHPGKPTLINRACPRRLEEDPLPQPRFFIPEAAVQGGEAQQPSGAWCSPLATIYRWSVLPRAPWIRSPLLAPHPSPQAPSSSLTFLSLTEQLAGDVKEVASGGRISGPLE